MQKSDVFVVIMAGGVGSRFWPVSKKHFPKQFHDFLGLGKSLLRLTFERHLSICDIANFVVVTNKDYKVLVKEQLPELNDNQILCEPFMRNTAPCIAYASYKIQKNNPDALLVVCPSDHMITGEDKYLEQIQVALKYAEKDDVLITLGMKPTRPDTGYGYIKYDQSEKKALKKVKTFTEKPDFALAQAFIESGDYVWNAGIFIWSAKAIIKAFAELLPEEAELFNEGIFHYNTDTEEKYINNAYQKCKNISIDYGVMEKANNVYTVLSTFGWSDLGTWNTVHEMREKNEANNVLDGNILAYNVENSIVKISPDKIAVIDGIKDMIIIEHNNVLLICSKNEEQKIKQFVADVKNSKNGEQYL